MGKDKAELFPQEEGLLTHRVLILTHLFRNCLHLPMMQVHHSLICLSCGCSWLGLAEWAPLQLFRAAGDDCRIHTCAQCLELAPNLVHYHVLCVFWWPWCSYICVSLPYAVADLSQDPRFTQVLFSLAIPQSISSYILYTYTPIYPLVEASTPCLDCLGGLWLPGMPLDGASSRGSRRDVHGMHFLWAGEKPVEAVTWCKARCSG